MFANVDEEMSDDLDGKIVDHYNFGIITKIGIEIVVEVCTSG
jgi:hypothetical protein